MYYLDVTIHVLAAVFWLGGMFLPAAVGAPVLRGVESPALRAELFRRLGERARGLGWIVIAVLLITGVLNLHFRGVLSGLTLGSRRFWTTPFGAALAWTLAPRRPARLQPSASPVKRGGRAPCPRGLIGSRFRAPAGSRCA